MTAILRAPELSATSRIDRIWIMVVLLGWPGGHGWPAALDFCRLPNHAFQRPAFPAAHRSRFDDRHGVARLGGSVLVVHHEFRRPSLGLAVQPVPHLPLDR